MRASKPKPGGLKISAVKGGKVYWTGAIGFLFTNSN
jgi:hypothetical protein